MIILSKKRIMLILSVVFFATLCFTINTTNTNETIETVALPISDKVIVIDAGHRKTR